MNDKMRGIVKNDKASTIFVLAAALAALLLSTASELANAKSFSNSGNYLVNNQNCTAGNTCNLSSSNTVTGSSGLTTPPPSTAPTPTTLTVSVTGSGSDTVLQGTLRTGTGSDIVGATITFTAVRLKDSYYM